MSTALEESVYYEPVTASDEGIDAALPELAVTVLMMSVVHMTGSMDIIRQGPATKLPLYSGDATGGFTESQKSEILDRARDAICQWRDAGCPPPYQPNDAELQEMMDYLAGVPLGPRYVPLLKEDLGMLGEARAFVWQRPVEEAKLDAFPVLIVGAGMSGLLMGFRLKQAGIPFTIVEKNSGVGGTWFENRYPGCRVDVPSHCYSYSFVHVYSWPDQFSPQQELQHYFEHCADLFGLREHIAFDTELVRAVYDEAKADWAITLRDAQGQREVRARALVSAVGQLNRPSIPHIKGEESFTGPRFHTAQWQDDVSLAGKRVAVIGTAATAVQLVPELAAQVAHLSVFQRTPNWIIIHPEYRRKIKDAEEWALRSLPFYARWYRVMLYTWGSDGMPAHMQIDPEWEQDGLTLSAANAERRVRLEQSIRQAVGEENSDLLEKVIPRYPPFVKRPNPGDGGYFRALLQDNVDLVVEGVAEIIDGGIVDAAGQRHAVDVIIYATGFKAMEFLAPMDIRGLQGQSIQERWGDEPGAYLGMTVPGFPNLFMLYGPGTNLGFNGNLIFNSECQARYIGDCIGHQIANDIPSMQVRETVYEDYGKRMEKALASFSWSHNSTGNWYKNARGKVIANSPWPLIDYWSWTRHCNSEDFEAVPQTIFQDTPQDMHPHFRAIVDAYAAAERPFFHQVTPAAARDMLRTAQAAAPKALDLPALEAVSDETLQGPHGTIGIRRYLPRGEVIGTCVFCHGGGWVLGDLDTADNLCRRLAAEAGVEVVSVDYCLAPEFVFPLPLEDVIAVVQWANSLQRPIVMAGESAGANLAAACAISLRDQFGSGHNHQSENGGGDVSGKIVGQLLAYPVTDHNFSTPSYNAIGTKNWLLSRADMQWFWDQYCPSVTTRSDPLASPLRVASAAGLPPALLLVAELDPLRDEGLAYAGLLEQDGVPVSVREGKSMLHGYLNAAGAIPEVASAVTEAAQWMRGCIGSVDGDKQQ